MSVDMRPCFWQRNLVAGMLEVLPKSILRRNGMDEVPFHVDVSRQEKRLAVKVSGELDLANSSKLDVVLQGELTEADVRLVLDFNQVTFLDSEGLKVIVKAYRRIAEAGGEISIAGCSDTIGRLFDILGLRNVLRVEGRWPD